MRSFFFFRSITLLAAVTFLNLASPTQAAALWNEETDGDLSDNGLIPTQLGELLPGSNRLKATFNAGAIDPDLDYFSFVVPEGSVLTEIELLSWETQPIFEDIAFFAVQSGPVFDFTPPADRSNANGLLGWTHLRSTQVGSNKVLLELADSNQSPSESGVADFYAEEVDLYPAELVKQFPELPERLLALEQQWVPGAEGFDSPLSAGTYSFWLRQGSDVKITTEFDFKTTAAATPEPTAAIALLALTLGPLVYKRRQTN